MRIDESDEKDGAGRIRAEERFRLLRANANATSWTPELALKAATFGYLSTMPLMKRVVVLASGMLHPDETTAVNHMLQLGQMMTTDAWKLHVIATDEDWIEWMESV